MRRRPTKSVRSGGRTSPATHGYAGSYQYSVRPAYARRGGRRIAPVPDEAATSVETLYDRYTGYYRSKGEIAVRVFHPAQYLQGIYSVFGKFRFLGVEY